MVGLIALMFPFVMPWYDGAHSSTSLMDVLQKPAGIHGFITSKNGHLYEGDERIRFVGMNFTQSGNLPATRQDAEAIARRLAKYGINCVRLAALDYRPAPDGILQADGRTLDPVAMGRLDYFLHQLKLNGIYILVQLHVARIYPDMFYGDGTPLHHNGVDNFSEQAIALQKEYASALLEHVNPYTGTKYADEPAVAMVEINNENALSLSWWNKSLDRLPDIYRDDLQNRWNDWLRVKYGNDAALANAWPDESLGPDSLAGADSGTNYNAWKLGLSRGAAANVTQAQNASTGESYADIRIDRPGERPYDVQFYLEPISSVNNTSYTLAFKARSDQSRSMTVALVQSSPYRILYRDKVELTSEWKMHSFVFTPDITKENARLIFSDLATDAGSVQIAGVSLRSGGADGFARNQGLGQVPIVKRADFTRKTRQLQLDWIEFLADTEDRYWSEMYRFLRQDLKVKALIIGTQQSYSPYQVQQKMDVIDMHGYWDTQIRHAGGWFKMRNKPQIDDRNAGVVGSVASRRISGKPFIVSEYNYRGANTYATEADLLMLAYASLQDWDGVFIFNYANNNLYGVDRLIGDEGFNGHSNRFAALVPAALMFYRGDVKPSRAPFTVAVTRDALTDKMRMAGPSPPTYELGLDVKQALKSGISLKIVDQPEHATADFPDPVPNNGKPIVSDTGELAWDPGAGEGSGVFKIDTARTKAVVGHVKNRVFDLGGVRIAPGRTTQDWAAITLTAMPGSDSVVSGRVLLTATGKSINAGMIFNKSRSIYNWGKGPVLVEGVPATITLPVKAVDVRAWALNEVGDPKAIVTVNDAGDGSAKIEIDERYRTVWYMLEIRKSSPPSS